MGDAGGAARLLAFGGVPAVKLLVLVGVTLEVLLVLRSFPNLSRFTNPDNPFLDGLLEVAGFSLFGCGANFLEWISTPTSSEVKSSPKTD